MQLAYSLEGGENIDTQNPIHWFECDKDDLGFHHLTGEGIVHRILVDESDPQRENMTAFLLTN